MLRRLLLAGFLEAQVTEKKLVSPSDVGNFVVRFRSSSLDSLDSLPSIPPTEETTTLHFSNVENEW